MRTTQASPKKGGSVTPKACELRLAKLRKRLPDHLVVEFLDNAPAAAPVQEALSMAVPKTTAQVQHTAYTAYRDERLPVLTAAHPLATKLELDSRMQTGWRRLDAVSMEALHARAAAANSIAPRSVLQKVEVLPPMPLTYDKPVPLFAPTSPRGPLPFGHVLLDGGDRVQACIPTMWPLRIAPWQFRTDRHPDWAPANAPPRVGKAYEVGDVWRTLTVATLAADIAAFLKDELQTADPPIVTLLHATLCEGKVSRCYALAPEATVKAVDLFNLAACNESDTATKQLIVTTILPVSPPPDAPRQPHMPLVPIERRRPPSPAAPVLPLPIQLPDPQPQPPVQEQPVP